MECSHPTVRGSYSLTMTRKILMNNDKENVL
jgi:hypothetical protein